MADTTKTYVSDTKLLYYTQQLKAKLDELLKDAGGSTIDDTKTTSTNVWSAKKISDMINTISSVKFIAVDTLPEKGVSGAIYLIPNDGEKPNIKDEYIWLETNSTGELTYDASCDSSAVTVTLDSTVAKTRLSTSGMIDFVYDGTNWLDDGGNAATLSEYGITTTGTAASGDKITLTATRAGEFEKIGSTDISLDDYVKTDNLVDITNDQIDTIFTTVWATE